jgi:hypothetical protein
MILNCLVKDVVVRRKTGTKKCQDSVDFSRPGMGMERNCRRIIVEMQSELSGDQLIRRWFVNSAATATISK